MTPETREIFWARFAYCRKDIEATARNLALMYKEDPDDWFPWYVAAERQLTAQRIARGRGLRGD